MRKESLSRAWAGFAARLKKKKVRTSFHLDEANYKLFKKLCKDHDVRASKVINAFIEDFIDLSRPRREEEK